MIHVIKNQLGNNILDENIRTEINHALDNDLEYTYFEGKRIDIVKHKYNGKEKETLVKVEF